MSTQVTGGLPAGFGGGEEAPSEPFLSVWVHVCRGALPRPLQLQNGWSGVLLSFPLTFVLFTGGMICGSGLCHH